MSRDLKEHRTHATRRMRRLIALAAATLSLALLVHGCHGDDSGDAPTTVTRTKLDGNCFAKFAIPMPVFGPASPLPRVDARAHPNLTVTMAETEQQVLPPGSYARCGSGVTLGPTRVWTYQIADSNTGALLGPAHWPAVTIAAQRGVPTRVSYINKLPSFNPNNPTGPGMVQGELPVDQTVHWADPLKSGCGMPKQGATLSSACRSNYIGPVPAVAHLHGAELPAAYDGDPESWFTPNGVKGTDYHTTGNPGPGTAIYEYPNSQEPGTLWFHDHALGTTRLNVYAGLAGFYFLKDANTEPRGYPDGPHEIEMAVQDHMFDTTGQSYLPIQQPSLNHPFWSPIFEGDVAVVNGAAFPYLNVEPRRYRLHILNGSLNRGYTFVFGNAPVYLVGSDDNYFDTPVPLPVSSVGGSGGLPVSPGERADIIVDFSKFAGQTIELTNSQGGQDVQLPDIMEFRVASSTATPDTSCDPASPDTSTGVCARPHPMVHLTDGKGTVLPGVKIDRVRQMVLYDQVDRSGGPVPADIKEYVNNTTWNGLESPSIAHDFPIDGISELPRVGSTEMWEIVYLSAMPGASHPVHIHLSQFQVLNRQAIDVNRYLTDWSKAFGAAGGSPVALPAGCTAGAYCTDYGPPLDYATPNKDGALGGNLPFSGYLQGAAIAPAAAESGWKDTADAHSGQVLRILVRWTPSSVPVLSGQSYAGENLYAFDPTQGYYVWHCHVLTHEDNEMMRPYRVTN
ncbi:mulitcopper oxidase domain-containing protein [Caballeronia pedi]|uniref:Mulitcopper oxidase domain-containing protein n=1 Tax=Caballeronia pedi TaxID=1777141 RepID=A0A158BCR5_9BURK|nr:multicopper oxidase domain-containing protein [Caballeronia pedi]SAK67861.1 mulitcopper oxidase domain-containing protein [Caballeronia pedi]